MNKNLLIFLSLFYVKTFSDIPKYFKICFYELKMIILMKVKFLVFSKQFKAYSK